jgi:mRNA-degrading endonuclease RelE of RelBE toxin-antitoxin system
LADLDPPAHSSLREKLLSLAVTNPYSSPHIRKLDEGAYRVRQGDWRALLLIDKDQRVVLVDRVVRRDEGTY